MIRAVRHVEGVPYGPFERPEVAIEKQSGIDPARASLRNFDTCGSEKVWRQLGIRNERSLAGRVVSRTASENSLISAAGAS